MPQFVVTPRLGWQCPVCQKVHSPDVLTCNHGMNLVVMAEPIQLDLFKDTKVKCGS